MTPEPRARIVVASFRPAFEKERPTSSKPETAPEPRTSLKVAVALSFALALAGWWNALEGRWLPADDPLVLDHPLVAGAPARGLPPGLFYRPVRTASLALDHAVWETNPAGYHLTNAVIHATSAVLVYGIARALSLSPRAGILAAALYVAHPAHTDAVTPVAGRREVLVAMFYLAALLAYLRRRQGGGSLDTLLIGLASGLAIYTKEMAITLPATALALEIALSRGWPDRARAGFLAGFGALCLAALAHALALGPGPSAVPQPELSLAFVATAARAFAQYLLVAVWPVRLSMDHSHAAFPTSSSLAEPAALAGVAAVLLYAALIFTWRRRRPFAALAFASFAIALAPALSLVSTPEVFAEHTLHLPLAALAIGLAGLLAPQLDARPRAMAVAMGLLVALMVARTHVRNRDWRDWPTLLAATLKTHPACARARTNLGLVLESQGRPLEAEREYRLALALLPDDPLTLSNLGSLLMQRGAFDEAIAVLAHAVDLAPGYAEALNNLGAVQMERGALPAAEQHIRAALGVRPGHVPALLNLGMLLRRGGPARAEEAEQTYRQAMALDPENPSAYNNLGALYLDSRRGPEAVSAFQKAVALQPSVARWQVNLARALASVGQARAAEEALIRAATTEPAGTVQLECARLAFDMKNLRLARHFLDRAQALGTLDPELLAKLKEK